MCGHTYHFKVSAINPKKSKGEAELLGEATIQLLKGIKAKAAKSGKPLRRADLLKQGYSERFIAKLEAA
jgi:hypothetical protein